MCAAGSFLKSALERPVEVKNAEGREDSQISIDVHCKLADPGCNFFNSNPVTHHAKHLIRSS